MLRDTGLHAALAIALCVLVGVILQNPALGGAVGLLAGALVTRRWPPRSVATAPDEPAGRGDG